MRSRAATLLAAACAALALAATAAPAPAREGRAAGGEGRLGAAPAASAHPPPRYGGAKPPLDLPAEDLTHAPLDLAKRGGVSSDLPGPVTEVPADVLVRGVAAAAAAVVAAGMAGGGGKTANETTAAAAKVAAALLTAAQREGAAAGALPPPANYGEGEETAAQAYPRRREDGYPYPHVLRLALDFYHAQRSGPLSPDPYARPWRGPSLPADPFPAHFDAGDHLLLMFPYGQTLSLLGWAYLPENFRAGFEASPGAAKSLRTTLRIGASAVMAAHSGGPRRYIVQVGEEHTDHDYWGRPEDMSGDRRGLPRPVLEIDADKGVYGSDAAGQGVAALAAAALAWREADPAFAAAATAAARSLYGLATTHEGRFSDRLPIGNMYPSSSYLDDLLWAAAWMARLTGEAWFLERASLYWDRLVREEPRSVLSREQSWSCSTPAAAALLAGLSRDPKYASFAYLFVETHVQGAAPVAYTPAGLAYRNKWGSLRNAANPALVAAVYGGLLRRWGGEGRREEGSGVVEQGGAAGGGASFAARAAAGAGKAAAGVLPKKAGAAAAPAKAAAAAAAAQKPAPAGAAARAAAAPAKAAAAPAKAKAAPPLSKNATTVSQASAPRAGPPAARLGRLYQCWARGQARYALGDTGRSFVVGWGVNPPTHVHHRAASCRTEVGGWGTNVPACGKADFEAAGPNPQVHVGALAGGPNAQDQYRDVRTDYVGNEVALDYNAAFTGVLAMLSQETGDTWADCLAEFKGDLRPILRVA